MTIVTTHLLDPEDAAVVREMQMQPRSEIAIEFISVLGMRPVDFVLLAKDLGCRRVGMAPEPIVRVAMYPCRDVPDVVAPYRRRLAARDRSSCSARWPRNFRVLLDAMHFFRSGSSLRTLSSLGSDVIGYAQLCDVPLTRTDISYADEARYERMCPGEGELPLRDFLSSLPPDVEIGLEIPMRARAEARLGPRGGLVAALQAAARLITPAG